MDLQTTAAIIIGANAAVGGCVYLYQRAVTAPLGYESKAGFHYGEPPAPANSNVPPLTQDERLVLEEMRVDMGFAAASIAEWTGLPLRRVRDAQRNLYAKGLAELGPLFDEGRLAGRGYWLTDAGEQERVNLVRHAGLAA